MSDSVQEDRTTGGGTPAPQSVDLVADFRDSGVEEVLAQLDRELVGLRPVKQRIRETAALLLVDRARQKLGLSQETPTLHMSFTGNPGTGKTTVALRMADLLFRLGYVRKGHLVSVTRDDLVGQYIGHTAPKTKEVLKKAMGGVLFIDEAYYLYRPDNERDYGQEAIEILLQVMENQRDDLVVILAGYADRMDRFFTSNPGFRSRIAHHIDFPDYNEIELVDIAGKMVGTMNYRLDDEARRAMDEYIHLKEEAEKRDHRLIGKQQKLFDIHELSPGCAFFYPHGTHIYNKLMSLIRDQYRVRGFTEVTTPNTFNLKLWKTSGHYDKYKENLFLLKVENQGFGMKPMNCPGHCLMFDNELRSYRELPIRFADFGVLHRNEISGALTGLTRVRRFCQDDAHIFCAPEQIADEVMNSLDFLEYIYGIFGFTFDL